MGCLEGIAPCRWDSHHRAEAVERLVWWDGGVEQWVEEMWGGWKMLRRMSWKRYDREVLIGRFLPLVLVVGEDARTDERFAVASSSSVLQ